MPHTQGKLWKFQCIPAWCTLWPQHQMSGQSQNGILSIFWGLWWVLSRIKRPIFKNESALLCLLFVAAAKDCFYHTASSWHCISYLSFLYQHDLVLLPGKTGTQEALSGASLEEEHSKSDSSVLWHPCKVNYQHININYHGVLVPIIRHLVFMMPCDDTRILASLSCDWKIHEILML